MKPIKIFTMRVVDGGANRCRLILDIMAAKKDELPQMYLNGGDFCYYVKHSEEDEDRGFLCCTKGPNLYEGGTILETDFQALLAFVRLCADRLHSVNVLLGKFREEWKGEEAFTI
jgi:hypothetical protein